MGIDTMVFAASFAAGSYTKGQTFSMKLIDGPTVVRDGNGTPKLKRIISFTDASPGSGVDFPLNAHITNGNWNDEVVNPCHLYTDVMFQNGKSVQRGGDLELVVNSQFNVTLEAKLAATTTADFDAFVLIDIEYDKIPAVSNPEEQTGMPVTIAGEYTVANTAVGAASNGLVWSAYSVDLFKAGYKYLMTDAFVDALGSGRGVAFLSIYGASSQAGLKRIIPMITDASVLPLPLLYSEVMVKGPMTLAVAQMGAASITADVQLDFIRRG